MKIILKLLISLFLFTEISVAGEIKVFEFTEAELSQLEVRKVRGAGNKTNYSIGSNENGNFLKSSLTFALTVTHWLRLFLVVDKTLSIDILV